MADMATRRSRAANVVHAATSELAYAASVDERENTMKHRNRREIWLDTAQPIGLDLGRDQGHRR